MPGKQTQGVGLSVLEEIKRYMIHKLWTDFLVKQKGDSVE